MSKSPQTAKDIWAQAESGAYETPALVRQRRRLAAEIAAAQIAAEEKQRKSKSKIDEILEAKKKLIKNLCVNTGQGSGGGFTACSGTGSAKGGSSDGGSSRKMLAGRYKLKVIGAKTLAGREQAAQKLIQGIEKAADICKARPSVCEDNLGLTRDKMPQLSDAVTAKFLKSFEAEGTKVTRRWMHVGQLRATQAEINAEKVAGMAKSVVGGKFKGITAPIIVSRDGFILDGHHRWATLLSLSPDNRMRVHVVDVPIQTLLKRARTFKGVERRGFKEALKALTEGRKRLRGDSCVLTGQGSGGGFVSCSKGVKGRRDAESLLAKRKATSIDIRWHRRGFKLGLEAGNRGAVIRNAKELMARGRGDKWITISNSIRDRNGKPLQMKPKIFLSLDKASQETLLQSVKRAKEQTKLGISLTPSRDKLGNRGDTTSVIANAKKSISGQVRVAGYHADLRARAAKRAAKQRELVKMNPSAHATWKAHVEKRAKKTEKQVERVIPKRQRSLKQVENEIRGRATEKGVVFDREGNIVWEKNGGKHSVSWPKPLWEKGQMMDGVFTHNHPNSLGLSRADMDLAIGLNMAEIRATGVFLDPKTKEVIGTVTFSLKRPEGGWPSGAMSKMKTWDATQEAKDLKAQWTLARLKLKQGRSKDTFSDAAFKSVEATNMAMLKHMGIDPKHLTYSTTGDVLGSGIRWTTPGWEMQLGRPNAGKRWSAKEGKYVPTRRKKKAS